MPRKIRLFPMVQTGFLSCGNHFLLLNLFSTMETVTEISGNPFFLEKKLFPVVERDFPSIKNCFFSFHASFLQVETITETS